MEELFILIVDDQREVLTTVSKDLEQLNNFCTLEECESPDEAYELLEEIDADGNFPAVIISDHVMPGTTGVEFLSRVSTDSRFKLTKKVLLTGLATHEDTIHAINQAHIHKYIEKPWEPEDLVHTVRVLITEFLLDKGVDYDEVREHLDNDTILERMRNTSI